MLAPLQLLRLKQAAHDAVICEIGTRLPAELTVAQWALESGWGSHQPGDNCFGIKVYDGCFGVQSLQTIEEVNGSKSELLQNFAVFPSLAACFQKHADLISGGKPYADVWQHYLEGQNLQALVKGVAAIYATDSQYAMKLWQIISMAEVVRSIEEFRQASLAAPAPISEPRRVRLRLLTNASLPRVRRWFRASFSS